MRKTIFAFLTIVLLTIVFPKHSYSSNKTSGESASFIKTQAIVKEDLRVKKLQRFLEKQKSPLSSVAGVFIQQADENNIDWRLVAAISGVESGFGRAIPANSYNGWGWGVYGNNVRRFSTWNEAITTISHSLREDYMNKWGATDIYSIGRIYASSPTWAKRVLYFMNKVDDYQETTDIAVLPISL